MNITHFQNAFYKLIQNSVYGLSSNDIRIIYQNNVNKIVRDIIRQEEQKKEELKRKQNEIQRHNK